MSDEKEPVKKDDTYMNQYSYLADSIRALSKVVLPDTEQMMGSCRIISDFLRSMSCSIINANLNFSEEMGYVADVMAKSLKTYLGRSIVMQHDLMEKLVESISGIQKEQLQILKEIDFTAAFSSMYESLGTYSLKGLSDIAESAYKAVCRDIADASEDDVDFISEEEFREVFDAQMNNPKGIQQKIHEWSQEKIIKYFVIWQFICFLYSNFFQPYFQENVGVPVTAWVVSNVKELPQKGANIICQLKEEIEAVIIENTNYYYKVSFTDENGVKCEGYVAKRNLKLLQKDIEDAEENEATEKNDAEPAE